MENSAGVGGFGDGVDVFKEVALEDGLGVVYAASFVEVAVGPMVRGELVGIGCCRLDAHRRNRTDQRFHRRDHV